MAEQGTGDVAAETFTPAAREALAAFPIEPDGLELVSLAENVGDFPDKAQERYVASC
jgi:hypothetical protein